MIISIPPPLAGGTNSDESIDHPLRCSYNKSEKLYYKARGGKSYKLSRLRQHDNQCKFHLPSTNKWFYQTVH